MKNGNLELATKEQRERVLFLEQYRFKSFSPKVSSVMVCLWEVAKEVNAHVLFSGLELIDLRCHIVFCDNAVRERAVGGNRAV